MASPDGTSGPTSPPGRRPVPARLEDRPRPVALRRGLRRRVRRRGRLGDAQRLLGPAHGGRDLDGDDLVRHRVLLPDGPGRPLGLALEVPDLQHDARPAQAGRGDALARRGRRADAIHAVSALAGRHPHRDRSTIAPLAREVEAPGRSRPWRATGRRSRPISSGASWPGSRRADRPRSGPWASGRSSPLPATVKDVPPGPVAAGETGRVVVEVAGGTGGLRVGDRVRVGVRCPIERIEPFRSLPTVPPPLSPGEPRRLYSCMEHAGRRPRRRRRAARAISPGSWPAALARQSARPLVVPDASRGDGRPPGLDVRGVRRDGPRPPRGLLPAPGRGARRPELGGDRGRHAGRSSTSRRARGCSTPGP